MAEGFKKGVGGANPLNFKVLGGTTEPTNPKENTIWVNTDKKITGYYFSATQPENMTEGDVWIVTGENSHVPFDALKKNCIRINPLTAKQYINGLVDKTAKTWQDGKWVDWFKYTYLFKSGEGAQVRFSNTKESNVTITQTDDCVTITATESDYGSVVWLTTNKVSLANAKKLVIRAKCKPFTLSNDDHYTAYFYVLTEVVKAGELYDVASKAAARIKCKTDKEETDYIIDVSGLGGSYYIGTTGCHKETYIYDVYYTE